MLCGVKLIDWRFVQNWEGWHRRTNWVTDIVYFFNKSFKSIKKIVINKIFIKEPWSETFFLISCLYDPNEDCSRISQRSWRTRAGVAGAVLQTALLLILTKLKSQQNYENQDLVLTGATWYYKGINIVFKWFESFTGYEGDIFQVIFLFPRSKIYIWRKTGQIWWTI